MDVKSGDEKLTPDMVEQEMARQGLKRYRLCSAKCVNEPLQPGR